MIPVSPPEVAKTHTPLIIHNRSGMIDDWYEDKDGVWQNMIKTQEQMEFAKAHSYSERSVVVNKPTLHYTSTTKFRYPAWRRIEDRRIAYSMSGIELSQASKFNIELVKPLIDPDEQADALRQLLNATIEYGMLAPEPCTERWIDSDNDYIVNLQNLRIELHNFFVEHKIIGHDEGKERQYIWDYLNASVKCVDETFSVLEELGKEYTYGMFDPEKKYKKHNYTSSKKRKKKNLTKINKAGKVKR